MNDAGAVRRSKGITQLADDPGGEGRRDPSRARHEAGQRLTLGPFQGQVIQPVLLAEVVGADDVGVSAGPDSELAFAEKAFDRDRVGGLASAENLDGRYSPVGVVGPEDQRGATFSYVFS